MEKYLKYFMDYIRIEKNLSDNTIIAYRKDIEQYFELCKITELSQLNKVTIRDFLSKISNLEPTSRRRKLSSIRAFMSFLHTEEYIDRNYGAEIQNAKIDKKLPQVLSVDNTARIIESTDNIRDRALLEMLYGLGCRVSELVNIKVSDIDFENWTVRLFGKGNKERIVPVNKSSILAINKYLATRKVYNEYVFPMTSRNARRIVYKYGGKEVHPHMFRHSYATHLHANGVGINAIKDLLGHADISTTTIYTHLTNEQLTKSYRNAHPRG